MQANTAAVCSQHLPRSLLTEGGGQTHSPQRKEIGTKICSLRFTKNIKSRVLLRSYTFLRHANPGLVTPQPLPPTVLKSSLPEAYTHPHPRDDGALSVKKVCVQHCLVLQCSREEEVRTWMLQPSPRPDSCPTHYWFCDLEGNLLV